MTSIAAKCIFLSNELYINSYFLEAGAEAPGSIREGNFSVIERISYSNSVNLNKKKSVQGFIKDA